MYPVLDLCSLNRNLREDELKTTEQDQIVVADNYTATKNQPSPRPKTRDASGALRRCHIQG